MSSEAGYRLTIDRLQAGRRTIIENFSCELPATGVVCLVGPNGAGKSVLIRALAQVDRRQRVSLVDAAGIAPDLSVAFDFAGVLASEGLSSLLTSALWFGADEASVVDMLARLGIDPTNSSPFAEWSLGARQRARLAAALASRRPVVLLDEPFRSIDDEHRFALLDLLVELAEQQLIVVSTHHPELLSGFTAATLVLRSDAYGTTTAVLQPPAVDPRHQVSVTGRGIAPLAGAKRIESRDGVAFQNASLAGDELQQVLTTLTEEDTQIHSFLVTEELGTDNDAGSESR